MRFWRKRRALLITASCKCGGFVPGEYQITCEPFATYWQCRHCGFDFQVQVRKEAA